MLLKAPTFEIRTVSENDLEALLSVYRQCEDFLALSQAPKATKEMVLNDFKQSREHDGCFYGIFIRADNMIGVIDTVPENFSGLAGVSFIALLMIAKPHRGHGLGEKVVKMLEIDFTRNHGCKIMRLGVMTNNPGALRFWERLGYRIYKGPVLQPDKTLVVYLQKKLTISRRGRNPLLRFL